MVTPIILATQEAGIRKVTVRSQAGQKVLGPLSRKTLHKNRAGVVAQGEGPEFKPQYRQKKRICSTPSPLNLILHPLIPAFLTGSLFLLLLHFFLSEMRSRRVHSWREVFGTAGSSIPFSKYPLLWVSSQKARK
jgi:hypothetical protein